MKAFFLLLIITTFAFCKLSQEDIYRQLKDLENVEVPDFIKSITCQKDTPCGVVISQESVACFRNQHCETEEYCTLNYNCESRSSISEEDISKIENHKNHIAKKRILLDSLEQSNSGLWGYFWSFF